jgi:AcrR family transcriptional regulator
MVMTARTRSTAGQRRTELVEAALREFSATGLHGTSTEAIARRAGISHAYLFRLFGTKKDLFLACCEVCFERTRATFETAAAGATPQERLRSMGSAYVEMLSDRELLLAQMQLYAACADPDICALARAGFEKLRAEVARLADGASPAELYAFFAQGMLLNVAASMDFPELGDPDRW